MIKSSDKSLQNTYRILRVLSNKDYLATDHDGGKYIFSQTKKSLLANISKVGDCIPSKNSSAYLLHHIQILSIDNLQYAVFSVGNHEVIWAPLMKSKSLQSEKRVQKIFQNSILNLLRELIWMGGKAKQYLDIRNFWFVNEQLYLLLLPRVRKSTNSLRKSEQVFQERLSTIDAMIDTEKTLMKQFSLLLWQICFQENFYQSIESKKHLQVKQILQKIIGKMISFEELVLAIKKKLISQQNGGKVRFRLKSKLEIFSKRKTIGAIEKQTSSSNNSLGISRMNTGFTENLKGVRSLEKANKSFLQKTNQDNMSFNKKQNRSMSQGENLVKDQRNPRHVHPRLFQRHIGQQESKNTIQYQTWLQKKKYSYDIKQKILKNSLLAREKYNQTILNSSEEKQIPKFQDVKFKEKILAKVIKFKSAFKSNYTTNAPQQISHMQKQSRTLEKNQNVEDRVQNNIENLQNSQQKQNQSIRKQEQMSIPSNSTIAFRSDNKITIQSENRHQTYYFRPKNAIESNRKQSCHIRNSKYKRIDMNVSSQKEQDIEVIELKRQSDRLNQEYPKQTIKTRLKSQASSNLIFTPEIEDTSKVKQIVNQYLLMINILGDITVRSVKIKDKLSDLNWRLITYFLYERFYFQRQKFIYLMKKGQIICRRYTAPPSKKQWIAFSKSQDFFELFNKTKQENEQIFATLEKLGKKLLEEGELDAKIEHFLRNQRVLSARKNSKLRSQLCKFLAAAIINEYEFVIEQALNQELVVRFLTDCSFGMLIISELEGLLLREDLPDVDNYKEYGQSLSGVGKSIRLIQKILANSK